MVNPISILARPTGLGLLVLGFLATALFGCQDTPTDKPHYVLHHEARAPLLKIAKAAATSRYADTYAITDIHWRGAKTHFVVERDQQPIFELVLSYPEESCAGERTAQFCLTLEQTGTQGAIRSEMDQRYYRYLIKQLRRLDESDSLWRRTDAVSAPDDKLKPIGYREVPCQTLREEEDPDRYNVLNVGVPRALNIGLVGAIFTLLLILFILSWRHAEPNKLPSLDLMRQAWVKALFRLRIHPQAIRWLITLALLVVMLDMLLGSLSHVRNLGHLAFWQIWWPLLPLLPLLLGRIFCAICPVSALAGFLRRHGLKRAVPPWFAKLGLLPAMVTLLIFGVLDQLIRIEDRPWISGQFLLIVTLSALVMHALYRERVFCRQICPVGAIQGLLGRLSAVAFRWRTDYTATPACRFGLVKKTGADDPHCGLCGDCWRGNEQDVTLSLRPPVAAARLTGTMVGEAALMFLLLAHVLFEQTLANDIGAFLLLLYEHAFIVFQPNPPLPAWLPYLPIQVYLMGLLLSYVLVVFGARLLLLRLARIAEAPLSPETSRRMALGHLPLVAFSLLALMLPQWAMLPDLMARLGTLIAGGAFSDIPLVQASDFPVATLRVLREMLILFGLLFSWLLLKRNARSESPSSPALERRLRAEIVFAVLMTTLLLFLFALPTTTGDAC